MQAATETALLLARAQFAFVIAAHIVFPTFTIGLASYLAVLEGLSLNTGRPVYRQLSDFWTPIFAVVFGMGVVSGLVMSYQFGTNWAVFSDKAGPIIGPLMGYEVLSAFFLEAGFLGIMLFGRARVGKIVHFGATLMVAFGTLASTFWILAANSWMQTPQGHGINAAGQFVPLDWWAVIFNPSFPYRLTHMTLAAFLTTALVVGGTGAWHLLFGGDRPAARTMLSMAFGMILCVAPLQVFVGDLHGLNTLKHQPAKVAAMEGHWDSLEGNVPLILFGIPDEKNEVTRAQIAIPYGGSLILNHALEGSFKGMKDFPPDERPPMTIVFYAFRIMVGLGFAMLGLALWGAVLRWRGRLYDTRAFLWSAVVMTPAGFISVVAGWFVTEIGRQPYTVYGLLRTDRSASALSVETLTASLTAFVVIYLFVFGAGLFYVLRLMLRGPDAIKQKGGNAPLLGAWGADP